jgi:PST family polysaccharide transporter
LALGSIFVLSRLLTPAEIGVVALAVLVSEFAGLAARLGFGEALVQSTNRTSVTVQATYVAVISTHVPMLLILWGTAPLIASTFGEPELGTMLWALEIKLAFEGLTLVPFSLARRDLAFHTIFKADTAGYVVGTVGVAIPLAFAGWGGWALIVGYIVQAGVRMLVFFVNRPHPVQLAVDVKALLGVFRYGLGHGIGQILNYAATNADYAIVGRNLSTASLGAYTRAYQMMLIPVTYMASVAQSIAFPAFSLVQREKERLMSGYLTVSGFVAAVVGPASAFLVVSAPYLVRVLLGPGWDATVLPLRVLSAVLLLRSGHKISDAIIAARGVVYLGAALTGTYLLAVIGGAVAGSKWGLVGVSVGVSIAIVIRYVMVGDLVRRQIGVSWTSQLRKQLTGLILTLIFLLPLVPGALVVGAVVESAYLALAILVFVFTGTAVLLALLARKSSLLVDVRFVLRAFIDDRSVRGANADSHLTRIGRWLLG